jgi:Domain of unknown function (DUF4397)
MFRLLKALTLMLALAALGLFVASCGSGNSAKIRVINAIPDAQASLDVDVNGNKITGSTPLAFESIFPSQGSAATYTSVPSGTDTIAAFLTNTTGSPVTQCTSCSLSGSTQYTVVLDGFAANGSINSIGLISDNNTAPTTGSLEFRIIDASANTPSVGLDVYITPPSGDTTGITPQTIALGQATSYITLANAAYNLVVTPHGNATPDINFSLPEVDGSIRTIVIVDNSGGSSGPAQIPLVFTDLN